MLQFSSVAQSCPTFCDPMNHSTPGLPVHHQLLESTQTRVHCYSHLQTQRTYNIFTYQGEKKKKGSEDFRKKYFWVLLKQLTSGFRYFL